MTETPEPAPRLVEHEVPAPGTALRLLAGAVALLAGIAALLVAILLLRSALG